MLAHPIERSRRSQNAQTLQRVNTSSWRSSVRALAEQTTFHSKLAFSAFPRSLVSNPSAAKMNHTREGRRTRFSPENEEMQHAHALDTDEFSIERNMRETLWYLVVIEVRDGKAGAIIDRLVPTVCCQDRIHILGMDPLHEAGPEFRVVPKEQRARTWRGRQKGAFPAPAGSLVEFAAQTKPGPPKSLCVQTGKRRQHTFVVIETDSMECGGVGERSKRNR